MEMARNRAAVKFWHDLAGETQDLRKASRKFQHPACQFFPYFFSPENNIDVRYLKIGKRKQICSFNLQN